MKLLALVAVLVPVVAHADPVTFEASLGVGEQLGISAPTVAVGFGGWIAPHTALTLRAAALSLGPQPTDPAKPVEIDAYRRTFAFIGPSVQYWLDDHLWLGAGIGYATMMTSGRDLEGYGAELRAGYAFGAFDLALEVTPSHFPSGGGIDATGMELGTTTTGVALLAGYQLR